MMPCWLKSTARVGLTHVGDGGFNQLCQNSTVDVIETFYIKTRFSRLEFTQFFHQLGANAEPGNDINRQGLFSW